MALPAKFPAGTKFFYCDFMPSAELPDRTFVVYDPEPRRIPWRWAVPTEPRVLTEAEFRVKVAKYNAEVEQ